MSSLPRKGSMRARAAASAAARVAGTMRLKLLVLGDAQSGKSTLIRRYNADSLAASALDSSRSGPGSQGRSAPVAPALAFDVNASTPTVGIDFVAAPVVGSRAAADNSGRKVRVQANFFDVGGASEHAKVRAEFYADQHGVLFAFDLTSKSSWDHLDAWWSEVTSARTADGAAVAAASSLHAVVVGCKSDLAEGAGRAVQERDAKQWCKTKGASYFECSAKTGAGVTKAIDYLIEHAQAEVRLSGAPPGQPQSQPAQAASAASSFSSSSSSTQSQRPPSASPHHSPQHSPSSSFGGGSSTGSANISELSLGELRRECAKRGVSTDDCLEKSDVLAKLREHLAKERASAAHAAGAQAQQADRLRESVLDDVARWARGKDVRAMLNDIHGWTESSPGGVFLPVHASLGVVSAAYKKALLKIHPDKVVAAGEAKDSAQHIRATEMFKIVNAAFENFKKINEKRMSGNSAAGGMESAPAAAAAHQPNSSPRTRTQGRRG